MTWTRVCPLAEIPVGATRPAEVAGESVLLCRVDAVSVHAIADVCTHDDGPLDQGELDGRVIECPRHGARFDVTTGAVLRMPAVTPLATFPARVADGWVEIDTEGGS